MILRSNNGVNSKKNLILINYNQEEGARLIGGCCTTGPTEIKQISDSLNQLR